MYQRRPHIAIDARYLSHGLIGGVHTYLRNLSTALLQECGDLDYTFWIDDKAPFDLEGIEPSPATRVLNYRGPLGSVHADLNMGFKMRRAGASVVHFPANYGFAPPGVPTVITIHDEINLLPLREIIAGHQRDPRSVAMMSYLHLMTSRAVKRQPLVITVSEYARDRILRHSPLDADRVHVVYSAPDAMFKPASQEEVCELRSRLKLRPRVLLADGIKNPGTTLMAYRALPQSVRDRTSLVFFSRRAPDNDVQRAAERGECTLLLKPDYSDLVKLYSLADIFVFPSWLEGFGLPVLESMACGTPVLASNRGSLPEIVGDVGFTEDAEDHLAFARRILELFEDENLFMSLRERSLERAREFTWQRTARATQEVYIEALAPARQQRSLPRGTAIATSRG